MAKRHVPIIDLTPFREGGSAEKRRVAGEVGATCERIGFLVVDGHGVPKALIDKAFAVSRAFFDAPEAEKMLAAPPNKLVPRGYQPYETRNLAKTIGLDVPNDMREQFFMGPLDDFRPKVVHIPEAATSYAPNIWPAGREDFRATLSDYYRHMETLGATLLRIFAVALALPEDYFADKIDHHFSTGTTNNYPAPKAPPKPGQLRAGAHTDFGAITILAMTEAAGGLQVETPEKSWEDVQGKGSQLVINLGDMMARWTNDRWRSTMHRVANPPDAVAAMSRRQTMGYFLHPNYDAEIACIPTCTGPGNPPRYPTIRAGDHMRMKLEKRVA